jgi:hypothetical protein
MGGSSSLRRFVFDFVDEVPDAIFDCLTPTVQAVLESVNPVTGLMSRVRAQYYVLAMHNMSLAGALTIFKVRLCACVWARGMLFVGAENVGMVRSIVELASWVA